MDIIEQLRRDEGEVLHAYSDSLGYLTIGVGRLIDSRRGGSISKEESAYLLQNDLTRLLSTLRTNLPWYDGSTRHQVLLNLAFDVGGHGVMGFQNLLSHLHDSNWDSAAQDLLDSKWALQVGDRAKRLAQQLKTGVWQ